MNENNTENNKINNSKTIRSKFFEYKAKLLGSTANNSNILNTKVVSLSQYLINCEIELNLSWSK